MSQQINLFNPALLKRKQHLSAVTMAQGLAIILIGAVAVGGYARMQTQALTAQASAASMQLEAAKAQLAQVVAQHAPRQKSKELEAELQRLEAEIAEQRRAFDIVQQGGVGDTKGYSEYLHAFSRQIVEGLWLTGFTIDSVGKRMELQGRALQPELVPTYIHRLKQEPVMQGKSFAHLMMSRPETEAEARKNGQGDDGAVPVRRVPARYMEFVLKSSGETPGKDARQDRGLLPAAAPAPSLPASTGNGALPNLRDMAGAH